MRLVSAQFKVDGTWWRNHYVSRYELLHESPFPWTDEPFSCLIDVLHRNVPTSLASRVARELSTLNVDFIGICGFDTEGLVSLFQREMALSGHQDKISSGELFVVSYDNATSTEQMSQAAMSCLGKAPQVLSLVVGTEDDRLALERDLSTALRS